MLAEVHGRVIRGCEGRPYKQKGRRQLCLRPAVSVVRHV